VKAREWYSHLIMLRVDKQGAPKDKGIYSISSRSTGGVREGDGGGARPGMNVPVKKAPYHVRCLLGFCTQTPSALPCRWDTY
jgi:hypothetical protein